MFDRETTRVIYLYTETPLHAGSGSSVGWVDLPIQREAHTGYPMVQGSGLKGALRSWASGKGQSSANREEVLAVFGPETGNASEHSGCLAVTDARILLFPVRAFVEAFAWVTCPQVLARFRRDAGGALGNDLPEVPSVAGMNAAVVEGCGLCHGGKVLLEDMAFTPQSSAAVSRWAETLGAALPDEFLRGQLKKRLAVVSDEVFRAFVEYSTEVITRIRIDDDTGTVAKGALWTEEHLPSDSLLYSLAMATSPRKKDLRPDSPLRGGGRAVLQWLEKTVLSGDLVLQLGGDETVGKGLVWGRMSGGGAS